MGQNDFFAQNPAWEAYSGHSGFRVRSAPPPPQEQCPLQDKFLTAAAYGYDYIVACFIKLIVRYRVVSPVSRFTARFISIRKGPPPVLRSFYEYDALMSRYYVAAKATYIRLILWQNGGFSALAP